MAACASFGASSTCRADFQAWVWTSMATRLSRFMAGEDAGEDFAIDISTGEHRGYLAPGEPRAFLADGGERRRAGALGAIVSALEEDGDRLRDLVVGDFDDALDVFEDQLQRRRVRSAHRHPVGEARRHFGIHRFS